MSEVKKRRHESKNNFTNEEKDKKREMKEGICREGGKGGESSR